MSIDKVLEELGRRLRHVKDRKLSEIDTQVLLIEPVLKIAGWNVLNHDLVHRASRSPRAQEFDIEIYSSPDRPQQVSFAIECKALQSGWFNIDKMSTKDIGQLAKQEGKDSTPYWVHNWKACDGVGQLRAYCRNYHHFSRDRSVAILTNGVEWVIFNTRTFVDESRLPHPISEDDIRARAKLTESSFE